MNDVSKPSSTAEGPWKMALEGSGVGVWDWNLTTGAQTHSRQWEEMLGYTAGENIHGYRDFETLVHPDDLPMVQAAARAYMDGRTPEYAADIRMRCKDGSWKWILTRGTVVERDLIGSPLRMIGTHTDISERKRAEEELRAVNAELLENTQLLQTTLTSISQGILLFDAALRVRKFNPRVCELLDLPIEFLSTRPTEHELVRFQLQRGDFGPDAHLVEQDARSQLIKAASGPTETLPTRYVRQTLSGRTLEVRTQLLPDGGKVRTFADVSDYVQAEADRKRLNQLLDATQTIAGVGGWERDFVSGAVYWTEGIYRILEVTPEEYTPGDLASTQRFFTPEARAKIQPVLPASDAATETTHDLELEMVTWKGRHIWVRFKGTTRWENGRPLKRTSVLQDVTELRLAEATARESEARWKLALESIGDGVWDWYIQEGTEFFSERLLQMCGYGGGDLNSNPDEFDDRTHPDDLDQLHQARLDHFEGRAPLYHSERRILCKDGSWKWVLSRGMVISRDADGKPLRMIGTFTDISSRKAAEALIRRQAFYDTLTGLPNRRMMRDRLEQEIKRSKRDQQELAILFIDLDHFKEVNDTLGHDRGDMLLVEAGRRIQACVRASDTVARMGGDEFTVILAELPSSSHLEGILQKLLRALGGVFQLGTEQVFVSASIGITMYPTDATEIEDLLKNADQALYVAKGAGRNRFSFFTPALQEAALTRVRLASDLRTALLEQQFHVVYQPIVELATGAIHKAEALIRWRHPTRGLVSPAAFIPIAESSGLIVEIGDWVFQQAARQVQAWRTVLSDDFQISVNRSPVQFHHNGATDTSWAQQLSAQGLPGDSIVVEITEGLLLDTNASVAETLLSLRAAGIGVSLDDFGTGYSSLSYLQKFDIDFVKIDQSFVRHLSANSTELALCRAIVVMAHALDMRVIAEGVETAQQRDLLASVDCDYVQGYLYAQPMLAPDFEAFVTAYRASAQTQLSLSDS
ncbi:EAL domain-containing protein [Rhodoferax sp. AJA081-3]|uniref:EAL domain-containing protein n=1 Tax=Rhodoferax sp. AJA081-3 TaxID=2752316 RepID=UPI001AE02EEE|nr:EAL domain-containing protein [Rhodoferax sp. AJA081-3]QTN26517.1 EAL domain-containing protein [Rhodoferax sp. AJA081-3]